MAWLVDMIDIRVVMGYVWIWIHNNPYGIGCTKLASRGAREMPRCKAIGFNTFDWKMKQNEIFSKLAAFYRQKFELVKRWQGMQTHPWNPNFRFVQMKCLDKPGHVLYPGYAETLKELATPQPWNCPDGFNDWFPIGQVTSAMLSWGHPLWTTKASHWISPQILPKLRTNTAIINPEGTWRMDRPFYRHPFACMVPKMKLNMKNETKTKIPTGKQYSWEWLILLLQDVTCIKCISMLAEQR